jgi:outer membrane protein TolC
MSAPVMTFLLRALLLIAALGVHVVSAQPLTLDQVVSRAVKRANDRETARVSAAIASEQYLESQSKFHLELRPRAGLMAFSNPALLASSLGVGILLGSNRASSWALQNARLDAIAAEIGAQRATMAAEREALGQYFALLQKQKATDAIRDLVEQRRARLKSVAEKAKAAEATAIDAAVLETGVITLETQLEDAETQEQIAAAALGELLGAGEGEELRVADIEVPEHVDEVPSIEVLYSAAKKKGGFRVALREKLNTEKKRIPRVRPISVTPPSASYAHIDNHGRSGVGLGQGGFLLGGSTGSLDIGLQIFPGAKAENAALATAISARISALESELADLDDSVRSNLDTLRLLVVSTRRKAERGARKLELADRIQRLTSVRERSGLASSQAVITAEMDASRARADWHQAESERDAAWTHLMVACDLGGADTDIQKSVAWEGQSENPGKSETEGLP